MVNGDVEKGDPSSGDRSKRESLGLDVCVGGVLKFPCARSVAVTIHRLRCGKALTGTTLKHLGAISTNLCGKCGVKDDVLHVLETCSKCDQQRTEWKKQVHDRCGRDDIRSRLNCEPWMFALFVKD